MGDQRNLGIGLAARSVANGARASCLSTLTRQRAAALLMLILSTTAAPTAAQSTRPVLRGGAEQSAPGQGATVTDALWLRNMRSTGWDPEHAALDQCQRLLGNGGAAWQLIPGNVDQCDALRQTRSAQREVSDAAAPCWALIGEITTDLTHAHDNYLRMDQLRTRPESSQYLRLGNSLQQRAFAKLKSLAPCMDGVRQAQDKAVRRVTLAVTQSGTAQGNGTGDVFSGGSNRGPAQGGGGNPTGTDTRRPGGVDDCWQGGINIDPDWQPSGPLIEEVASRRCVRIACDNPSGWRLVCPGWPKPPRWSDLDGTWFSCGNTEALRPPYCSRMPSAQLTKSRDSPCPGALDPRERAELRASAQEALRTLAAMGGQADIELTTMGRLTAARLLELSEPEVINKQIFGYLSRSEAINKSLRNAGQAVVAYLADGDARGAIHQRLWRDASTAIHMAQRQPAVALGVLAQGAVESSLLAGGVNTCSRVVDRVALRGAIREAGDAGKAIVQRAERDLRERPPALTGACTAVNPRGSNVNCVPTSVAVDQRVATGKPFTDRDFNRLGQDRPHTDAEVRQLLSDVYGNRAFPEHAPWRAKAQSEGVRTHMSRIDMERELAAGGNGSRGLMTINVPPHLLPPGVSAGTHMVNIHVENDVIRYFDGQAGKVNAYSIFLEHLGGPLSEQKVWFYRTN